MADTPKLIVKEAIGCIGTWYVLWGSEDGQVVWEEETESAAKAAVRRFRKTGSFAKGA
jgi:hypothetical protein